MFGITTLVALCGYVSKIYVAYENHPPHLRERSASCDRGALHRLHLRETAVLWCQQIDGRKYVDIVGRPRG